MISLKGGPVAQILQTFCHQWHQRYQDLYGKSVGLGVLRIGEDPSSSVYIAHKQRMAERLGYAFYAHSFSTSTPQEEVLQAIASWSKRADIHGMILQLPIPVPHCAATYLAALPPHKDVDGLSPAALFTPCTPLGCLFLLQAYKIPLRGAHALIVGRSALVGRPLGLLLLDQDATVTFTHSHTPDLASLTRTADLLCVCAGIPHLITLDHVRAQTTILDIGIHRTSEKTLTGDVSPDVFGHIHALSPVPGGVGPMTVMGLMLNTLRAAFLAENALLPLEPLMDALRAF